MEDFRVVAMPQGNLLEDALEEAMYERLNDPVVLARFLVHRLGEIKTPCIGVIAALRTATSLLNGLTCLEQRGALSDEADGR